MLPSTSIKGLLALATHVAVGLTLVASSPSGYQTVNSSYGDHALRYKSWEAEDTQLCDGGSKHYTGWADLGDRHLFFWYHEARHEPSSAPLLIWHQGGPGGSSLHGMLFENGPCLSDGPNATRYNPDSWTEYFNVVYLDQPAGVGFSYVDPGSQDEPPTMPSRTPASSLDSVAFIRMLYEAFPSLAKVDLHLSGESYAGRYVPTLAASILEYNDFFDPLDDAIIPLRSILVGNPFINPAVQLLSVHENSCFPWRGYPQHLDSPECDRLESIYSQCDALLNACERAGPGSPLCAMADAPCTQKIMGILQGVTRSAYDRRLRNCATPGDCFPGVAEPEAFLNAPRIFDDELEVTVQTGGAVKSWEMLSKEAYKRYGESGDVSEPTTPAIRKLLQYARDDGQNAHRRRQPLDLMIYVGVTDVICNIDGVLEALRDVDWPGKASFRGTAWEELPWKSSSGGRAGRVKAVPNLWLAEVEEAGHMVPYDQPASSLKLVKRWLDHLESGAKNPYSETVDQQALSAGSLGLEL